MALKIRLARGGSKKHPFYRIVVAEASSPRDGRFVERLGSYDPMVFLNLLVLGLILSTPKSLICLNKSSCFLEIPTGVSTFI